MATTTPNYGWSVPTSTDYVAQGAVAIETLGDSVDAFVATAFNSKLRPGLVLIKSQTISSGVSSVSITDVFNTNFDAYKIIFTGITTGGAVGNNLQFGTSNTGYYANNLSVAGYSSSGTANFSGTNNGSSLALGMVSTTAPNATGGSVEVQNPFAATTTTWQLHGSDPRTAGVGLRIESGFHNVATSYTSLTLFIAGTTYTGGRVSVYGYSKD